MAKNLTKVRCVVLLDLSCFYSSSSQTTFNMKSIAVSRIKARSDLYEMDLILDINIDVYPVSRGEKLAVCLASTLNLDGTPMPMSTGGSLTQAVYDPAVGTRPTLADKYDYVMFGRIFKYKDSTASGHSKADVFVSFGGLLMQLTGDPKRLEELELDQNVYLLMRKV